MTHINEIMHVVVEVFLHCSICSFQAQNVLIASLDCFQSALQILHVFLEKNNIKYININDNNVVSKNYDRTKIKY